MKNTLRVYLTDQYPVITDTSNLSVSGLGMVVAAKVDKKGEWVSTGYTPDPLGEGYALIKAEKIGQKPRLVHVNDVVEVPECAVKRIQKLFDAQFFADKNAGDHLRELMKEYGPADFGYETARVPTDIPHGLDGLCQGSDEETEEPEETETLPIQEKLPDWFQREYQF